MVGVLLLCRRFNRSLNSLSLPWPPCRAELSRHGSCCSHRQQHHFHSDGRAHLWHHFHRTHSQPSNYAPVPLTSRLYHTPKCWTIKCIILINVNHFKFFNWKKENLEKIWLIEINRLTKNKKDRLWNEIKTMIALFLVQRWKKLRKFDLKIYSNKM